MDHNNFSFHEINRTVGQDEASNHLISEDGIKGIHKLEEAVASHGNSISSTKKGNRDKVEHQAPKYRDYHRFMRKKMATVISDLLEFRPTLLFAATEMLRNLRKSNKKQ